MNDGTRVRNRWLMGLGRGARPRPARPDIVDDMARVGHPVFDVIIDGLHPAAGETIVDLGCGHGPALHALHGREPSLQLLGFDASAEAVVAVGAALPHVRAEVADLNGRLPLDDASVDGALSHNVLECLDDPVVAMNEAARVLRSGGRAVWSHTDFDGIMLAGPDRALTRRVLHAYADTPPVWTQRADGQLGRRLVGLVRRSRLQLVDVAVHLTTITELGGDARARVDEIAGALGSGIGSLTAEDVGDWRRQVDVAHANGEFLFCEPTFVVSARVS